MLIQILPSIIIVSMNKGKPILILAGVVVLAGLFLWPKLNDPNGGAKEAWANSEIDCLASHSQTAQHIHPRLAVFVDNQRIEIPAKTGNVTGCMAEVHTHDSAGTIHVESIDPDKQFKLKDFFTVWGQPLRKDGYEIEMTVDGKLSADLEELILRDHQEITVNYKKIGQ